MVPGRKVKGHRCILIGRALPTVCTTRSLAWRWPSETRREARPWYGSAAHTLPCRRGGSASIWPGFESRWVRDDSPFPHNCLYCSFFFHAAVPFPRSARARAVPGAIPLPQMEWPFFMRTYFDALIGRTAMLLLLDAMDRLMDYACSTVRQRRQPGRKAKRQPS